MSILNWKKKLVILLLIFMTNNMIFSFVINIFKINRIISYKHIYRTSITLLSSTELTNLGNEDDSFDKQVNEDDIFNEENDSRAIAKQLYHDLCENNNYLTKEKFIEWEDISDLLNDGTFDKDTIDIIFNEVGVTGDIITLNQFYELVELVNQVSDALDGSIDIDDLNNMSNSDNFGSLLDDDDDSKYKWLLDGMNYDN